MTSAPVDVARRWFEEVWNRGRTELISELLAADAMMYDLGAPADVQRGPEGFRRVYDKLKGAFPDIRFTIDEILSERDTVALRWTARMTHSGDHLGCPATDNPVTIGGMSFARIRDGKAVEVWNSWDMLGLLHQIGQVLPARVVPDDDSG